MELGRKVGEVFRLGSVPLGCVTEDKEGDITQAGVSFLGSEGFEPHVGHPSLGSDIGKQNLHLTPVKVAIIRKMRDNKCWQRYRENRTFELGNVNWYIFYGKK